MKLKEINETGSIFHAHLSTLVKYTYMTITNLCIVKYKLQVSGHFVEGETGMAI